jgi:osmotically-inducible protein OsmY
VRRDELSGMQIFLWTAFGVGTGMLTGFALSEWVGGVNQTRFRQATRRLGQSAPLPVSAAAAARAVDAAIRAEPRLARYAIEVIAVSRGTIELRGWVTDRGTRTLAGRIGRAVPGIDTVINSILVRGEDDSHSGGPRLTDQSA